MVIDWLLIIFIFMRIIYIYIYNRWLDSICKLFVIDDILIKDFEINKIEIKNRE